MRVLFIKEEFLLSAPNDREAKELNRKFWDYTCLFSNERSETAVVDPINDSKLHLPMSGDFLVCAHIYDSGLPEYRFLRYVSINMICIASRFHTNADNTFDYIKFASIERHPVKHRGEKSKIEWLFHILDEHNPEMKGKMCDILAQLNIMIKEKHDETNLQN